MGNLFQNTQLYEWAAVASTAAWMLTLITSILFFSVNEKWGKINDITSVIFLVFTAPLMISVYTLFPAESQILRLMIALIGFTGLTIPAVGQTLLIFRQIDFEGSKKYFPGIIGLGIWLVAFNLLLQIKNMATPLLSWIGMLTGAGIILTIFLFLIKKMENTAFYIGAGLFVIGYPIWAIMLWRLLVAGVSG